MTPILTEALIMVGLLGGTSILATGAAWLAAPRPTGELHTGSRQG